MYFFFSSRRRHTRLQGDWSSDVCSSDLRLELVEDRDDLARLHARLVDVEHDVVGVAFGLEAVDVAAPQLEVPLEVREDRKSTRLNSSHLVISYAVFCLKKKKNNKLNYNS